MAESDPDSDSNSDSGVRSGNSLRKASVTVICVAESRALLGRG